jgi:TolA-binding protein
MDFKQGKFPEAEMRFRKIVEKFPNTDAGSEALYWAGVSRYKATRDNTALKETAQAFKTQYQDSSWAKKASVWT